MEIFLEKKHKKFPKNIPTELSRWETLKNDVYYSQTLPKHDVILGWNWWFFVISHKYALL